MWSDLDQLMVPKRSARVDHPDLDARNVMVRGVGHMSLPIHRRTVHEIVLTLAQLDPHEVPLNFLNPRPGTPLGDRPVVEGKDALRAIAAFRLAMPRTILRYAGGREITAGGVHHEDGSVTARALRDANGALHIARVIGRDHSAQLRAHDAGCVLLRGLERTRVARREHVHRVAHGSKIGPHTIAHLPHH